MSASFLSQESITSWLMALFARMSPLKPASHFANGARRYQKKWGRLQCPDAAGAAALRRCNTNWLPLLEMSQDRETSRGGGNVFEGVPAQNRANRINRPVIELE